MSGGGVACALAGAAGGGGWTRGRARSGMALKVTLRLPTAPLKPPACTKYVTPPSTGNATCDCVPWASSLQATRVSALIWAPV